MAVKAPKKMVKPLTAQKPGGRVQPEKHTKIKTDRGDFQFREPVSSDWK